MEHLNTLYYTKPIAWETDSLQIPQLQKKTEKDAFYVIEVRFSRCRIRKMKRLLTGKTFSRDNHDE